MVGHGPHVKKAWPLRLFGGGNLPVGRRDLSGLALQARLWLDGTDAAKRTLIGVRPKKPSVVFMVNTNKASPSRPTRRDPQNPNSIEPSRGRNLPAVGKNKDPRFERFMFTGTQCDLWSRPVGTGHEKSKSREIPSTYFYTLIPSLHEHEASGGGHGRCLYCRLTSFSRSLQTILRINLDGTNNFAHKS